MRKFSLGLSYDLVLECKASMLNNDMDILRLVVFIQQVEDKNKKKIEMRKRQSKTNRYLDQGISQQNGENGGGQWFKKKTWGNLYLSASAPYRKSLGDQSFQISNSKA